MKMRRVTDQSLTSFADHTYQPYVNLRLKNGAKTTNTVSGGSDAICIREFMAKYKRVSVDTKSYTKAYDIYEKNVHNLRSLESRAILELCNQQNTEINLYLLMIMSMKHEDSLNM
jgi:hypothetical protein